MREKHLFYIKMSSRWPLTKPRDARKDVTPDVACKQSTSSVLVSSVSSVQKYKYMLSLLFVHISRTYRTKKKSFSSLKRTSVAVSVLEFAYFCSVCPAPFHPDVAGWCGFVVGCLLDRFCINNKGFSTVRGH